MRKLVLKMEVTLDCFVAATDGNQDWLFKFNDEGVSDFVMDTISNAGLHLMGSRVFNNMLSYWPFSDQVFAAPMNNIPKAVYTRGQANLKPDFEKAVSGFKMAGITKTVRQLKDTPGSAEKLAGWQNAQVLNGDLNAAIKKLKKQSGKYILVQGGSGFAQALSAANLVDEYRIITYPVTLGKGLPLFGAGTKPLELKLIQTHVFQSGTIAQVYQPK